MGGSATSSGGNKVDQQFMMMALAMARRGLGTTAPNPSVGAVIVDVDGVILGRGWTQPGGRPHAEVVALERAGAAAKGATLYVTLEPCSHIGKSPPCADAVIKAGIARVFIGLFDPDERVAGKGKKRLEEAGIEVVDDVMMGEPALLEPTQGHILRIVEQRPFVQLKIAVSKDGLIAPGDGKPVWVTGEQARAQGHLLRARADALLVGIGTVLADDPSLDCRLPGMANRSPDIIVLDRHDRLPQNSKIIKSGRLMQLPAVDSIEALLNQIANRGITRLLVEGGPHVWRSFLNANLVDEVIVFKGRLELGASGHLPFVDQGLELLGETGFKEIGRRSVGADQMIIYKIAK